MLILGFGGGGGGKKPPRLKGLIGEIVILSITFPGDDLNFFYVWTMFLIKDPDFIKVVENNLASKQFLCKLIKGESRGES